MEKIKFIFPIILLLVIFPSAIFAGEISLSFEVSSGQIELHAINSTQFDYIVPFKRGVTSVFLISTPSGKLFPSKNWKMHPSTSLSNGVVIDLPEKGARHSQPIARTQDTLSDFIPSTASLPRPADFPRLYLMGIIKDPSNSPAAFIASAYFELKVQNNRIAEINEVGKTSVPNEVIMAFNREIANIKLEEESPQFSPW